jgi:hypothetical protein
MFKVSIVVPKFLTDFQARPIQREILDVEKCAIGGTTPAVVTLVASPRPHSVKSDVHDGEFLPYHPPQSPAGISATGLPRTYPTKRATHSKRDSSDDRPPNTKIGIIVGCCVFFCMVVILCFWCQHH